MAAFKPNYIAIRSLQFLQLISKSRSDNFPPHILLRTLGLCVSICPPPTEHRREVVNIAWSAISNLTNPEEYISCVEAWVQFVVKYFTVATLKIVNLNNEISNSRVEKLI